MLLPKCSLLVWLATAAIAAPLPLEVMVLTDGPKLRRSDPWPSGSPIFDARTGNIKLAGARNEVLGFQVLLRPAKDGTAVEGVDCTLEPLVGLAGARIGQAHTKFFRAWFVEVREPSFTGGIPGLGPGEYPDPLVPVDSPTYGAPFTVRRPETLFVDLYIPPEARAGEYRSALTIRARGRAVRRLPLRLKVWNFALPEESHLRNYFAYESEFLRWGFRKRQGDDLQVLERALFQLAWEHRANLSPATRLKRSAAEWEEWVKPYAAYLDGSAYLEGPGKGRGGYCWRISFDPAEPEETLRPKLKAAADWLESRGWLDRFVVVCFDEPKKDRYEQVRRVGRLTREASGGRLRHFLPGARPDPVFQDYVDIWDGVWVAEDLPALNARRHAGQRVWYYGGLGASANPVVDSRAYGARSWAWVAWKYGFEGWEMWQSLYWADKYNTPTAGRAAIERDPAQFLNVWKNPAPLTFDEARQRDGVRHRGDILQNGGAVFFYPGVDVGLPGQCVPSLRLKDFRRGMQDYEYLYLLREAGDRETADAAVAAIYNPDAIAMRRGGTPKISTGDLGVTMDDTQWESTRRRLGERLDVLAGRP